MTYLPTGAIPTLPLDRTTPVSLKHGSPRHVPYRQASKDWMTPIFDLHHKLYKKSIFPLALTSIPREEQQRPLRPEIIIVFCSCALFGLLCPTPFVTICIAAAVADIVSALLFRRFCQSIFSFLSFYLQLWLLSDAYLVRNLFPMTVCTCFVRNASMVTIPANVQA